MVLSLLVARTALVLLLGVDFSREVLPVLADNCFPCHGPDAVARKGKLRLDTPDGAARVLKADKGGLSELVRRLSSTDPGEVMPPPEFPRRPTPAQSDAVRRWVADGAKWERHWSFVPPRRAGPPPTRDAVWPRNAIDHFILSRMEKDGARPGSEAPRETWLRRVTYDLTGLPPTLGEIDAFRADRSAAAYERALDRLFASPRYGERLASDWLDVARYADTHGYQMDRFRPMWPYRDWVVRAFNANLPYDAFVTWQLAGDLLPNPTQEQRLATAFNRLHMQNEEGGVVEEEFRVAYVVDRVNTFGTAFLGLTLDCARCHDHKYDPIRTKDYYSLFSFFQNIDEAGQTSYFTPAMPVPTLLLTDAAAEAKLTEVRRRVRVKEKEYADERARASAPFEAWLKEAKADDVAPPIAHYAFDDIKNRETVNGTDARKPGKAHEAPTLVDGKVGRGVALDGENGFDFPGVGHFRRTDPFALSLWLKASAATPRAVVLHHSRAPVDAGSRGYELLLESGRVAFGLHHMWPRNSVKVITRSAIPLNSWTHIAVTYDGSSQAAGVRLFIDGHATEVDVVRDGLFKDITYEGGEPNLALGYRFRDNGFKGGQVDELRVYDRSLTPVEVARLAGRATPPTRGEWFDHFVARVYAPSRRLAEELRALRQEESRAVQPVPEAMVMEEMTEAKAAFVLKRGAYDAPGERVAADTPASLPPFPVGAPRNRLGLARWLLAPDNPLAARVAVNRFWQLLFGRGLVETSDNFGSQGTPPTHPELLDWLARDFADHGWDVRRLLAQMALSATYRQASIPARRLTAEMLRDRALAVSGLLVERLGGPAVKPYQPDGLWEVAMGRPRYDRASGADLYRRSLYTFWKRTVPPPGLVTFDAAERNVCVARRQSTSTPLQALTLLNDPQTVEAARRFGQRLLREGGPTTEKRAAWAFRVVTGREATPREVAILKRLFEEQRDVFRSDLASAKKLLAVGEATADATLDPAEAAAAAVLGLALLNHDEAVLCR